MRKPLCSKARLSTYHHLDMETCREKLEEEFADVCKDDIERFFPTNTLPFWQGVFLKTAFQGRLR
jgi:hypothetical protein